MTNSDIRKHLRKGEQAVAILESLGYTYRGTSVRPEWVAPKEKPEDAILAPIIKALAELKDLKESQVDETIRKGDRFIITVCPPNLTAIRNCWPDWKSRVFTASEVNDHSRDEDRKVIRFGHNAVATSGLWIDVTLCQKVHEHDRF